jgi:hypothetical protein
MEHGQQKLLVVLGLTFGNLLHLSCRGPTSFERRFLKEFQESLPVLVMKVFFCFELFLQRELGPYGGQSAPACLHTPRWNACRFSCAALPIFPPTSLGTIQGGLTLSAVLELELRRCSGATDDGTLHHDCCKSGTT